jgi:hypothetical protein
MNMNNIQVPTTLCRVLVNTIRVTTQTFCMPPGTDTPVDLSIHQFIGPLVRACQARPRPAARVPPSSSLAGCTGIIITVVTIIQVAT